MSKTKVLLAMGIILLFVGLSVSPATAKVIKTDLTEKLNDMDGIIPELMEKMSQATSFSHLLEILTTFTKGRGNHPIIGLIMMIIREIMDVMNKINGLRPLKTNA